LKLVQRDQQKQSKLDRLQQEWEELKKLVSTKRYPEVNRPGGKAAGRISWGQRPGEVRGVCPAQQTQLERDGLLRKNATAYRPSSRRAVLTRRFVRHGGAEDLSGNEELRRLQQQAEVQDKKQQTRRRLNKGSRISG